MTRSPWRLGGAWEEGNIRATENGRLHGFCVSAKALRSLQNSSMLCMLVEYLSRECSAGRSSHQVLVVIPR